VKVGKDTEVLSGDVLDPASLTEAFEGVRVAYYLVHSMGAATGFEEIDRQGARNFARAAEEAGCGRIIYLGGLGESGEELSAHLRSRMEVGDILREGRVPVIEFRASIVLGSGSLSFEMIRALVERLPIMVTPRWVSTKAQPIGIEDLLSYLVAAIDLPVEGHQTYEIGGADRVSYGEIMQEYARQRGLRRFMIPVPVLTPRLSSLWLGLVTPLYARVGRKLVESLRHPTVVTDDAAWRDFPIRPVGVRDAIAQALRNEEKELTETRWSDALSSAGAVRDWTGVRFGSRIFDGRTATTSADPARAFRPIRRIGGESGWYYGNWLWSLRGFLDLLVGGVGIRRGRPHPDRLHVGDTVDCWRVEQYEPDRRLRLVAEMKLPGRAWLEYEVQPEYNGTKIIQTATFEPVGLLGLTYWYVLFLVHELVFAGMLRGIVKAGLNSEAEDLAQSD
jgi:uncharacterized protein YbjT (DUF2867 family)